MLLTSENQVFCLRVTHVWDHGSGSPQLWSFLGRKRFCHLRGGPPQGRAWPLPFPVLFFKMFEKEKCCSSFCLSFFSWNSLRMEPNQNLGLNSLTPDSHGYRCFEPSPSRTRMFSSFLPRHTCSFPLLCLVVLFWSPALSSLHPDPSLSRVWVTRAITLPASTYSVPQLLG